MSLMTALISHLLAHEGLSALVGARVYVEKMPASTSANPNQMPLVTTQLLDEPLMTTHGNNVIYKARVEVDAWGGSYKSAENVAEQVQAALQGYRGAMGDQSVTVGGCFRKAKRDASNEDVELFRKVQEYVINYKE